MKFIFLTLFCVVSSLANAKTIEITIPDDTFTYDKISVNFDHSIAIDNPKVFANGEYLPFINSTYQYAHTANIACMLFGFSAADSSLVDRGPIKEDGEMVAHLGYTKARGVFLAGVYKISSSFEIVTQLNCQPLVK
jgi:hypothetical protein